MRIVLIPCASTEWREEGRLLGRVELRPTPAGEEHCAGWVEALTNLGLEQILHAPDELATRTANLLGRQLLVPTKAADALAEVDVGLWAGLTDEQVRSRFSSAHRELCESPLNVSPPGGERLGAADARLKAFLKKQNKRNGGAVLGLVLRPVTFAMARCALEGREPSTVWEEAQEMHEPIAIEFREEPARAKS